MLLAIPPNRVLEASIAGTGLPTIILPKNISHLTSRLAVAGRSGAISGTVFVYEPAGSGASSPGPFPRTTSRIVTDLEQALASAGLHPPHIVAGYSATGFEALLFAYRNKAHTRGVTLIDPSIPFMNQNLYRMSPMLREKEHEGRRRLVESISELEKKVASFAGPAQLEHLAKFECQLSEWDNLHTGSSEEIVPILKEPQALDGMQVLVLNAGKFDVEEFCRNEIREV